MSESHSSFSLPSLSLSFILGSLLHNQKPESSRLWLLSAPKLVSEEDMYEMLQESPRCITHVEPVSQKATTDLDDQPGVLRATYIYLSFPFCFLDSLFILIPLLEIRMCTLATDGCSPLQKTLFTILHARRDESLHSHSLMLTQSSKNDIDELNGPPGALQATHI